MSVGSDSSAGHMYAPNEDVQLSILKGPFSGSWVDAVILKAVGHGRYGVFIKDTKLAQSAGCDNRTIDSVPWQCLRYPNRRTVSGSTNTKTTVVTETSEARLESRESETEDDWRLKYIQQKETILSLQNQMKHLLTKVTEQARQIEELKLQKELLIDKEVFLNDTALVSTNTNMKKGVFNVPASLRPSDHNKEKVEGLQKAVEELARRNKKLTDALSQEKSAAASFPLQKLYQEALRQYRGDGTTRNPRLAFQLASHAANRGHARAQCLVGLCFQNGVGVGKDHLKAFSYFLLSAMQGYVLGQYNLAWCYFDGDGVRVDKSQAFFWFYEAALQGKPAAQYSLGYCYRKGEGIEVNHKQAYFWFSQASEQKHVLAMNSLGLCFEHGEGVPCDEGMAFYWYKRASDAGDVQALYNLGLCYHCGRGTPMDHRKSIECFKKAASEKNADAIDAMKKLSALATLENKYSRGDVKGPRSTSTPSSTSGTPSISPTSSTILSDGWEEREAGERADVSRENSRYRPWVQRLAKRMTHGQSPANQNRRRKRRRTPEGARRSCEIMQAFLLLLFFGASCYAISTLKMVGATANCNRSRILFLRVYVAWNLHQLSPRP
uniref:Uncharacterized protein n=1 Tax=Lotharella globosa TaxID=91324 RepID=A0A7S3YB26_9EUKA